MKITFDAHRKTEFTGFNPGKSCHINRNHPVDRSVGVVKIFKNKVIQGLKDYFIGYPKRIRYTARHKKAFLQVEKELTGKNTLGGYFHDTDKLIMYILGFPKKVAHNIHVATAPHHYRNGKIKKPLSALIDWESARFTKPDKPLSSREFYESYFVKKLHVRIQELEILLDKLGL